MIPDIDSTERAASTIKIGEVSANELADVYGTPLYVYDGAVIRARVGRMLDGLTYRPLRVFYSVKATGVPAITRLLIDSGFGVDACSPGDLRHAELAGCAAEDITYVGYGSTDAELIAALDHVGTLIIDNVSELRRLGSALYGRRIGIRTNPNLAAGFHTHVQAGSATAKFGVSLEELMSARDAVTKTGAVLVGLHAHIGSDVLNAAVHAELIARLAQAAHDLPSVEWIDVGGGYGTPRQADEAAYDWQALDRAAREHLHLDDGRKLELRLEPGGYLTMDAGYLLARVTDVLPATAHRPTTAIVDTNTNHLVSRLLYDAWHPLQASARSAAVERVQLAGNVMQAADVLWDAELVATPRRGDVLALGHAGAYASSRSTVFNGRPRPAEVLVDGAAHRLIRRAERVEDLFVRDVLN